MSEFNKYLEKRLGIHSAIDALLDSCERDKMTGEICIKFHFNEGGISGMVVEKKEKIHLLKI